MKPCHKPSFLCVCILYLCLLARDVHAFRSKENTRILIHMSRPDSPVFDAVLEITSLQHQNGILENAMEYVKRDLRTAADAAAALDSHIDEMVTECKNALMDCNKFCVQADMHTKEVTKRMRVTDARFLDAFRENQSWRSENTMLDESLEEATHDRVVAQERADTADRNYRAARVKVERSNKMIQELKEANATLRIKNRRLVMENEQAKEGLTLKEENDAMKRHILQLQCSEIRLASELAETRQENTRLMTSAMVGMVGEGGEDGATAAGIKRKGVEELADAFMDVLAKRLARPAAGRLIHAVSDGASSGEGLTFSSSGGRM